MNEKSDQAMSDKRQFPRFPVTQRCWCESTNVTMYITMVNISRGGVFLKTAIPLQVGQRAKIMWRTADEHEVEAEAEVMWCCQGQIRQSPSIMPGMGLRFLDVVKGQDKLESFFDNQPAG